MVFALMLAWLSVLPSWAAHAYAQFGDIKYPAGFSHFDYVNPTAPKGGEIRMVPPTRATNFDKFNPFTLKGIPPYALSELMLESLLIGNSEEPTTAYGLLAQDVTVAVDGLSATFKLNPAAKFHHGKPVLAADVLHSFKQLTSKLASPQYQTIFAEVKGAIVIDERTIRFDFAIPNPELPLIVGGIPVFSQDWGAQKPFDKIITDVPIGSGPYKILNPKLGRDITYQRDSEYWGKDHPTRKGFFNFDRINFKIYLDETSRFEGLKAGEFDYMREFVSRNWARQYKGKQFDSGELVKQAFENRNPGDFQGYVLNLRKSKFQDVRVRQAIGLAMDFEWLNRQLFYGLYKRVNGYFPNSEFSATGMPKSDELVILEPLRSILSSAVFGPSAISPSTAAPSSLRQNLLKARSLLEQAGWTYRSGALRNVNNEAFTIEYLTDQPSTIRGVTPLQKALEKLGITLNFRQVDASLSQQKMDTFDFEMTSARLPGTTSPGSEQIERFGSKAATTTGSSNIWGISDSAVDVILQKVVQAKTRPELSAAMRSLDRVLGHGYYSIPQWYGDAFLIGYRAKRFSIPSTIPPYYQDSSWAMSTWWIGKQ